MCVISAHACGVVYVQALILCFIAVGLCWDVANRTLPGVVLSRSWSQYSKLPDADRRMWDVKFINVMFALTIIPLVFYCLNFDEALQLSPLNGTSAMVRIASAVAVGFFIWDCIICIKYLRDWGPAFLFHGLFCLAAFSQVAFFQIQVAQTLAALYYELSTPFLNTRWYMQQARAYSHPIWDPINYAFAGTFILVRIFYGSYLTHSVLSTVASETCLPWWARLFTTFNACSSFGLNCKWGVDIISSAMKVRKPEVGKRR